MSPWVAWIGVGNLGAPMLRRVIAAGHRPLVFDVDPKALEPFAETVDPAPSLAVAATADVIVSTLPRDSILVAVGEEIAAAMSSEAVFCDMSTVSPEASAQVAEMMGDRSYLRAPVSGSVSHAEKGILTVLASGPEAAFDRCRSFFECFASRSFYVGQGEEARYLKLVVNNLVGSTAALMAESLALASKAGLDPATTLEVLANSAVASPLVKYKVEPLKARDFTPTFTTEMMIKDMGLFADAAEALGTPAPMAAVTLDLLRQHAMSGGAEEDFFGLVKLLERQSRGD